MKIGKKIEIETINLKFITEKLDVAEQQLKDGSDDLHFRLSHFRKRVVNKHISKYDEFFFGKQTSQTNGKPYDESIALVPFEEKEEEAITKKNTQKWIKALYRKIVSSTHPDKFINFPVKNLKKKYLDIYRKTVNAWEKGMIDTILIAAYETDIPVTNPEAIQILQTGHKLKGNRLKEIHGLLAYQWFSIPDAEKSKVLENYLKQLGYEFTPEQVKKVVNLARKRKVGTRPMSLRERKNVK